VTASVDLRFNASKNVVHSIVSGKFSSQDAEQYVERFIAAVDNLAPGFTLIFDITDFIPTEEDVWNALKRGTAYAVEKGMARVIRVVGDSMTSKVGNIQWNRAARDLGYQVDVVENFEQAQALLNAS